jgi:hypothetical protein
MNLWPPVPGTSNLGAGRPFAREESPVKKLTDEELYACMAKLLGESFGKVLELVKQVDPILFAHRHQFSDSELTTIQKCFTAFGVHAQDLACANNLLSGKLAQTKQRLNPDLVERIRNALGRKTLLGEEIALKIGAKYEYIRRVLPQMCQREILEKTPKGYRVV